MKTDLHIRNFGKVKSADIRLSPFTVIVGPNSSGKSFITKALYSIFHSMNKDLTTDFLMQRLVSANEQVFEISRKLIRPSYRDIEIIKNLLESLSSLEEIISDIYENITILDNALVSKQVDSFYPKIRELFDELYKHLSVGKGIKLNSVI
ncbi:AAA family ATPase, partial [Avibacterium avium]|uniref:AAA family ATPase n=1 Tax=Avibacterium avium TaxID=751 RepID=UPI003BF87EBC